MTASAHIAIDLGAESGRVIVGVLDGGRLDLHEVHRFRHLPVPTPAGLCWDLTGLWRQVLDGLTAASKFLDGRNLNAQSVGVDTWGVDWTLLGASGELLGLPRCYRDPAFEDAFAKVTAAVTKRRIYDGTGIQLMSINTLYQYYSRARQEPGVLAHADTLLFMPDLLHWLLCGVAKVERTIASTSQMVDVRRGDWNRELLGELGLPDGPLDSPVDPGTAIGTVRDDVAQATGLPASVKVVLPPSHDTASAIAAAPAEDGSRWCYLSSGTWSLLGAELPEPCITDAAAEANFTNELGVSGTVRFLKNLTGLWLVQEVRRDLERDGGAAWDYAELTEQAAGAPPLRTLIPVNDPAFGRPGGAVKRLQNYARQSGQPVPESVGAMVRCCLESLALEYRATVSTLESVLGREYDILHILGGGGKNGLLNRMTAHATGKTVIVGPDEATAMGNLLTQAVGTGHLVDLAEMREVVRRSTDLQTVQPDETDEWSAHAERYTSLPAVKDADA